MANTKDSEMIAAAILAAGFTAAQRQSISSGRTEDSLREKYIEFLAFIRGHNSAPTKKKK
jgi:hypothetical protein